MTAKGNDGDELATENLLTGAKPSLPQLCDQAADHVARARIALFDEADGSDQALAHLDEAIFCLKRLWQQGNASSPAVPADVEQRRSA